MSGHRVKPDRTALACARQVVDPRALTVQRR
jgi:hypothetical protein